MKRLALLGASGHGRVVADAALLSGWGTVDFYDDAWPRLQATSRWKVLGSTDCLISRLNDYQGVVVSIGDCLVRFKKSEVLLKAGATMPVVVHPSAVIGAFTEIGAGTVILAGAVLNADAKVGPSCILNTGSIVDHDCQLSTAVHVCPGAVLSGGVAVGDCSWIGAGATVKQGVRIGAKTIIGAGAVVITPVVDGSTVVGNPAKPLC